MHKALVVGGNGFIGSHLVDKLLSLQWDVTVLDIVKRRYDNLPDNVQFLQGDFGQPFILREALINTDVVFHLAWSTIHETSNQDLNTDISANLISTIHLLEACRHAGIYRLVFVSSGGTVYGLTNQLPIRESYPKNPINSYGIIKLTVEKYLQMFKHLYGLDYAVLRPSVPYGPRQNPLGRQGAVAVFMHRIMHGLPITIWGDGSTCRDYFYISDLIDAFIACVEKPLGQSPVYNIGGGEEITLLQLINEIEVIVGQKASIKYQENRLIDSSYIVLNTDLSKKELSWEPKIPLVQGLGFTYRWMKTIL